MLFFIHVCVNEFMCLQNLVTLVGSKISKAMKSCIVFICLLFMTYAKHCEYTCKEMDYILSVGNHVIKYSL